MHSENICSGRWGGPEDEMAKADHYEPCRHEDRVVPGGRNGNLARHARASGKGQGGVQGSLIEQGQSVLLPTSTRCCIAEIRY